MPLSEHERRQLEQIEAALRAGDPRFAEAVRAADPRVHYRRRVIAAVLGLLAGVGPLLAGVVVNVILVAPAGFVVMLACSMWAVTSYRRMTGTATGRAPVKDRGPGNSRHAARGRRPGQQTGSGLMGRLEERWRRRRVMEILAVPPVPSLQARPGPRQDSADAVAAPAWRSHPPGAPRAE